MPVVLHHVEAGPVDAPVVLLGPSLGTTLEMWDDLAASLAAEYRVVRFDTRGHGRSPVPAGPYSVAELVDDVIALVDSLGIEHFAYVGLSLGGLVGQALAVAHPDRVAALVLACTGPRFGDPASWRERSDRVRAEGMAWLVEPTKGRWFTAGFVDEHPDRVGRLLGMIASVEPEGYASCCDAIAAADTTSSLGTITAPTLVVSGSEDPVSPPSVGRVLAEGIPKATFLVLDGASHIANVAMPEEFNSAVRAHLRRHHPVDPA